MGLLKRERLDIHKSPLRHKPTRMEHLEQLAYSSTKNAVHNVIVGVNRKNHGLELSPTPSDDPKDPLRWSKPLKLAAIAAASLFNFVGNFTCAGPATATQAFQAEFGKSAEQVNDLLSYAFLMLAIGNLVWVPFSVKFGKRPVLIVSMLVLLCSQIWAANVQSYGSLLGARMVSGFAASAGESIVPAIVSDIFFLHERAAMMAIYVILAASGSAVGPMVSGYFLGTPGSWRSFTWLCVGLCGANLILLFFCLPESDFTRSERLHAVAQQPVQETDLDDKPADSQIEVVAPRLESQQRSANMVDISNPTFAEICLSPPRNNKGVRLWATAAHPFIFLLSPTTLWAIYSYGILLSAQIIMILNMPSLLIPPPYLFSGGSVGLMQVAAIIGFVLAMFVGGYLSDIITAREIIKNKGNVVTEQRLKSLIPFGWVSPLGCLLTGLAGENLWPWYSIAIAYGMLSFGVVYAPNIAITYVVDSFPEQSAQCLVSINVFKNMIGFLFTYQAVTWIQKQGFLRPYIILMALQLSIFVVALPLYWYGKRLRHSTFLNRLSKALQ